MLITNIIKWKVKKDLIEITMIVKNIHATEDVQLMNVKRWADITIHGELQNDWVVMDDSVFVADEPVDAFKRGYGIMMAGLSPQSIYATVDYPMSPSDRKCVTDGHDGISDVHAAGTLEWPVNEVLSPGEQRTFKMLYRLYK